MGILLKVLVTQLFGVIRKMEDTAEKRDSTTPVLKIDDLVFAKVRGYPYWPAKITGINQKGKTVKYSVCFFGTQETATLPGKSIVLYNDQSKKEYGNIRQKSFVESIAEIQNIEPT